jgi:hypothetical protein
MKTMKFEVTKNNHFLFDIWLWLHFRKFNKQINTCKHREYDHLGIIDTLGFDSDKKMFTYSYSDELTYMFGFDLKIICFEFYQ